MDFYYNDYDDYTEINDADDFWYGHRGRLRMRAERYGFRSLKDHEMLEILLYHAQPRQDMAKVAQNIMDHFGSFRTLIRTSRKELMSINGVTNGIADWLMMYFTIVNLYLDIDRRNEKCIMNLRDVMNFILPRRRSVTPPETWAIYLNQDRHVMMNSVITESLSWAEAEYTRQCIAEAGAVQAKYMFIVQFVGIQPLEFDDYDTRNIKGFSYALRAAGVEVQDVILVGETDFRSMNRSGLMDALRLELFDRSAFDSYITRRTVSEPPR